MKGFNPSTSSELEPTFSLAETAKHLGCGRTRISELVDLGLAHGARLHPTRGGLWPTFKISHKNRRVPLSAIDRHKRHMAKIAGEPVPPPTIVHANAA
jgi:hypothetical protein